MPSTPSTVIVLNDDLHLSSLLEQLLAGDARLLVVAKARTTVAALALCWESPPQAIVVEQHSAGIQWWDILADLRRYCPDSCIVLLTDLPADDRPQTARLADHVLSRTSSWRELADLLAPPVCEAYAEPVSAGR